jgi:hypothetical protein
MRQALVLVFGAIALSSLGGASAANIDWKSLTYFDYPNQRLRLSTDTSWSGSKAVDAANLNLAADTSWPKLKRQWIWSPTCGAAAQRVVFSKTFLVPGVPLDGNLSLSYGPGNQFYGGRPYVSATFLVNGVEMGRLGDLAHFPRKFASGLSITLTNRDRAAFRHGPNTATIRVTRAALKKGEKCTRPAATSGGNVRYIAVGADLSLGFGSDLVAVPPAKTSQVKRDVKSGDTVTLQGTVAFKNNGPSTSLGGTAIVTVNGDGQALILENLSFPNAPFEKSACTFGEQQVICKYAELPAGAAGTIHLAAGVKANTGYFRNGVGKLTLIWSVTGPSRDPGKTANNTAQTEVVMCVIGSPDPACA